MTCYNCGYKLPLFVFAPLSESGSHRTNCHLIAEGIIVSPINWDAPENMCKVAFCWEPGNEPMRLGTFTSYKDLEKWKPPGGSEIEVFN